VSELMPHTAKIADDICFIKSMHTDPDRCHGAAGRLARLVLPDPGRQLGVRTDCR
jgi:hypothetical protein